MMIDLVLLGSNL